MRICSALKRSDIVNSMDFWGDVYNDVDIGTHSTELRIAIGDIPNGAIIIRAIMMFKYVSKTDTSGNQNMVEDGKIMSKEETAGSYVEAIVFEPGDISVEANAKEWGDVYVGNYNISGVGDNIIGNVDIVSVFDGMTLSDASIELYGVQMGIRVYFR